MAAVHLSPRPLLSRCNSRQSLARTPILRIPLRFHLAAAAAAAAAAGSISKEAPPPVAAATSTAAQQPSPSQGPATAVLHPPGAPGELEGGGGAEGEGAAAVHGSAGEQYSPDAQEYIEVQVTTEVEEEVQLQPREVLQEVWSYCTVSNVGRGLSVAAGALLLLTLGLTLQRLYQRATSPAANRRRLIEHNKQVVAELSKFLPAQREKLTAAVVKAVQRQTGFTPVEVFRKYLWYVLRLGKFDHEAVQDMIAIKAAAGLSDVDVAQALRERAQRVYEQYGTLMLHSQGFTTAGLERHVACRALFQKLQYLSECEALVAQGSEAAKGIDLRTIFGATEEDLEKIRLASLYDVDLEKAFSKEGAKVSDSDE